MRNKRTQTLKRKYRANGTHSFSELWTVYEVQIRVPNNIPEYSATTNKLLTIRIFYKIWIWYGLMIYRLGHLFLQKYILFTKKHKAFHDYSNQP